MESRWPCSRSAHSWQAWREWSLEDSSAFIQAPTSRFSPMRLWGSSWEAWEGSKGPGSEACWSGCSTTSAKRFSLNFRISHFSPRWPRSWRCGLRDSTVARDEIDAVLRIASGGGGFSPAEYLAAVPFLVSPHLADPGADLRDFGDEP